MQVSPEKGGEILCDTGWCVHKPDVQNKWDDNEDQCEWHRMTMMTEPDCAVISSLINTHTHCLYVDPRVLFYTCTSISCLVTGSALIDQTHDEIRMYYVY